jgi:regulatory protein YycH of two-component signal transduction system YycFG
MVVCIRKNSELKKMCEEYIKDISINNKKKINNAIKSLQMIEEKNSINYTIVKINKLLEKLISTRKGRFTTMGAKIGLTKIELNLK